MSGFDFKRNLHDGDKFTVEKDVLIKMKQIQVVRVVPGRTEPLELRLCCDFFGAEEMSVGLWSSKRLEPHFTNVELQAEGPCKIEAQGAEIRIHGTRILKRTERVSSTARGSGGNSSNTVQHEPDDDSCVLL